MRIVPVVMPKLPSAWSTRKVNTNGGLTGELSSGLPAGSARGCVQKLAYETDKLLVSKLASLKPSDLKNASELIHDVADFAQTPVYQAYRDNPEAIFPDPVRTAVEKRWLAPHRVGFAEWSWQSIHPLIFTDIEPVYRGHRENQTALLRTLNLRIKGKPMAILVNGFSSGHHLLERVAWPMREFHRLGINVSLFALPFHGPRGHSFPPAWPQQDTRLTIEGFRQAIWDLRTAIRALREAGASHVGVAGMSLGGYTVHGARLASHFGTELITFPGAHMLQVWRARAFRRALEGFLERGVLPRKRCFGPRRR